MKNNTVHSALGEVNASEMGWIHPHEHLLICMREHCGESVAAYPGNTEYARRQLVPMLKELAGYGVTGLVDPTPIGIGRDEDYVRFVQDVSASSGVSVFLATGLYGKAHWPQWASEWTAEKIGELFSRELENGIGNTGVRPCVIKAAVDGELAASERKVLTACAIAHRNTGASLHIHSILHRRATVDFLCGLSVDPTRIYLAHVDMITSEDEFLWLAERGVNFVTTNWDFPHHMDQEEAHRLINLLIEKGHLRQILVSIDFALTIESRWCVGLWTWDNPERTSYAYLHTGVLPKLRAAGVTDAHIETIMHDNPLEMISWG